MVQNVDRAKILHALPCEGLGGGLWQGLRAALRLAPLVNGRPCFFDCLLGILDGLMPLPFVGGLQSLGRANPSQAVGARPAFVFTPTMRPASVRSMRPRAINSASARAIVLRATPAVLKSS